MNRLQPFSMCLALSITLTIVAWEAWQQGVIRIDSNAVYHCSIDGVEQNVYGTRVSVRIKDTAFVWMQCKQSHLLER